MDWNDFFGGLASLAPVGVGIAAAVEGPAQPIMLGSTGSVYLPQTGQIIGSSGLLGSGSSSTMILLLIGLALFFAMRK